MQYFFNFVVFLVCLSNSGIFASEMLKDLQLGMMQPQLLLDSNVPDDGMLLFPLRVPEKIDYDVYHETFMSKVHAGTCRMELLKKVAIYGRPTVKFQLEALSAEWYSWFAIVRDSVDGYFDLGNSQSYYLEIKKRENSYRQEKQIQFDYQHQRIVERVSRKNKVRYRQYPLQKGIFDTYSIIYRLRRLPLAKMVEIKYDVYANGKIHHLLAKVIGIETLNVAGKKNRETVKVEVLTRFRGAFEQRGGIFIYFSNDRDHVPLRIEADVKIGMLVLQARVD